jgi:hypothetical protein
MENTPKLYISLFHGRKYPKQDMEGWGDMGPIIGPVDISWTYGCPKIHKDWDDWEHLPMSKDRDMVHFAGVYYGDFEIVHADDPLVLVAIQNGRKILSYDEAVEIIKQTKK